jgi:hypothetical protein
MGELRLRLQGRSPVFEGAPFCLACGGRPFGTRTVKIRDVAWAQQRTELANQILRRVHPILAWVNRARLASFKLDVPVCFRHFWKGRGAEIVAILLFLASASGLIWLALKGRLPDHPNEVGSVLKGLLIAVVAAPGYLLWKRNRTAPLLPCEVRREAPDRVLLVYPGDPPGPP